MRLAGYKNYHIISYLFNKETQAQIFGVCREMVRHLYVSLQDHIHLINQTGLNSVLEGVEAGNHFKHDQAETVPVYRISVVFVFYNFGS